MDDDIEFGFVARGLFKALCLFTVLLAPVWYAFWPWMFVLVAFLGLGLKPFLRHSGLLRLWRSLMATRQQRRNAPLNAQAAKEIERKQRDDKLRKTRLRNPELPPRW